jgi:hypothetical protein
MERVAFSVIRPSNKRVYLRENVNRMSNRGQNCSVENLACTQFGCSDWANEPRGAETGTQLESITSCVPVSSPGFRLPRSGMIG